MAVIKIPSSNIYAIENNNSLIATNKIKKAEISVNKFKEETGNVLSKQYVITYWQEPDDKSINTMTYVGDDKNVNEFLFVPIDDDNYRFVRQEGNNARFEIGKQLLLHFEDNGLVKNYRAIREEHYRRDQSIGGELTTTYFNKARNLGGLSYNSDDYTFSANIEDTIIFYPDGSSANGVPIFTEVSGTDPEDGEYWTKEYLLYETITVKGIYYSPQIVQKQYGTSNTVDFYIPENELVQEKNLFNTENLFENILQNVVRKYQNGKETYKLKCSIGDYYYTSGGLAIFPLDDAYENKLPATFKKHDIVEPWIYTSKGEVPLSEKADGTPRQFEVIGIDYSYAGVVWQKLTLQEYIE